MFAAQAAAHPHREAVAGAHASLSYGELDALSGVVAAELRRLGVGEEGVVALCLGRTPVAIVALLGALRAGCAVLPLDGGQPVERMQWALRESGARAALTRRGESAALDELLSGERRGEGLECAGLYLEAGWERAWAGRSTAGEVGGGDFAKGGAADDEAERGDAEHGAAERGAAERGAAERDIDAAGTSSARGRHVTTADGWSGARERRAAYIIYTSGSTGRPKGVVVEHAALRNLCWALRTGLYAGMGDSPLRVSLNAPLSFDASVKQWAQLAWGHTLVFLDEEVRADAEALLGQVRERGIEVLDCTPGQLGQLVEAGLGQAGAGSEPRLVLCGEGSGE